MIIVLSTDEMVISCAKQLSDLYPEERALRLESIVNKNYNLASPREIPIKRLTFIDHATKKAYGEMSVDLFAEHVIKILEQNESNSPGFIDNLEAIDFLGCEIGQINQYGRSFALDVTQKLEEKGYHTPIYAFNNDNKQFQRTILSYTTQWIFYGFENTEQANKFSSNTKHLNIAEEDFERLSTEAYEKLDEVEALEEQNSKLKEKATLGKTNYEIEKEQLIASKEEVKLAELRKKFKSGISLIKDKIKENNARIEILKSEIDIIRDKGIALKDEKNRLKQEREALGTRINSTQDPRDYFAKHPECNVSQKLSNLRKRFIPGEISREYRGNLKREKIRGDQHPLHHSNHHPRGH